MNLDPKVQRIIDWRESFAVLPDNHFFEIIRMYLGEVKTPFNKQKLIEELSAFIRKEDSRKTIVALLSQADIQIISAVKFISNPTEEKLATFFESTYTFAELYNRLLNLEERLILYRHMDKFSGKMIISINPHLESDLEPYAKQSVLLHSPEYEEVFYNAQAVLSPELIAAFVAFVHKNPDLCKADGTFKKRVESDLESFFPGKIDMLFNLTKALINLSMLKESGRGYEVDRSRLLAFSQLDRRLQYAYLCVGAQGRFSRNGLVRQAKLLLDVAAAVPEKGFDRSILLRLAYLISEDQNDVAGVAALGASSRFSAILNKAREENSAAETDTNLSSVLDRLIDCGVLFGIFSKKGRDSSGETIYSTGSLLEDYVPTDFEPKVLSIDAGFNVTLLPGLRLERLIPLMDFMELRQFDTAAVFEINRKSIMRGFDFGLTAQKIFDLLKKYSPYEIPQNLEVSVDDWSKSYSSATIYKGYILQVSGENAAITEKNPAIAPYISATLAPGIYLLSVESDEEASSVIEKSGLDFIGKIKTAEKNYQTLGFPEFAPPKQAHTISNNFDEDAPLQPGLTSDQERAAHFDKMRAELEKLNLPQEKKEGLLQRIDHKIILSPVQLRGDSVKFERIEAGGMDYSGKVHIIEGSISNNSMVELHFDDRVIVGVPLSVTKTGTDANVLLDVMPDHAEKLLSIGQAKLVKRIRGSVLR
ncbi:MAG: helicase-associated domain-containing protein [Treponema sp.]|nr:helicase-associated domain-containing protein [Candidatus Treponema equifaecale]